MQHMRRKRIKSISSHNSTKSQMIIDFDKVKEPVNAGKVPGKTIKDFGRNLWKSDRRNYR